MHVDEFDFELPSENIALRPANPRDAARLLLVGNKLSDHHVYDLPKLLQPGDILVCNDTRVIPARLHGIRSGRGETTPKIEATLHQRTAPDQWKAFAKPGRKLKIGDNISFSDHLNCNVTAKNEGGEIELQFNQSGPELDMAIAETGEMPLPPYIASKRKVDTQDLSDYQTMYACEDGAVAAPTAGLHFTPELTAALQKADIEMEYLTLHVGAGTFLPVKVDNTDDHNMHSETGHISAATAERLNLAKAAGRRIVAVGTTSLRLLESAAIETDKIAAFSGSTDIFITPGYSFRYVDALMTNFHLPRSTLFMLVSAFCGLDTMQAAYKHAIESGYRFYSYGDSSLLERNDA